jgi:hypothetical protein
MPFQRISTSNTDGTRVNRIALISFMVAAIFLISLVPTFVMPVHAATLTLILRPAKAVIGGTVDATGHGYTPGKTVTILFASKVVATKVADSTGRVTVLFKVPQEAPGSYSVTATDGVNSIPAPFTVLSLGRT